jgi:hypothetical protein
MIFEKELLKLRKAVEQYAHLTLEHPHVIKICESLNE